MEGRAAKALKSDSHLKKGSSPLVRIRESRVQHTLASEPVKPAEDTGDNTGQFPPNTVAEFHHWTYCPGAKAIDGPGSLQALLPEQR